MPAPDASFNQADEGNFAVSLIGLGGGNDSVGAAQKSEETELVGRTPAVLMARELFFRHCEFARNYGLSKSEALTLFNRTLDTVKEVWSKEAANTSVKIGDSLTTNQSEAAGGKLPDLLKSPSKPASGATTQPTDDTSGAADSVDATDSSGSTLIPQ